MNPPEPAREVPRDLLPEPLLVHRDDSEIPSDQLLRGSREIRIRHAGEVYRLRLTRNGKLILHK